MKIAIFILCAIILLGPHAEAFKCEEIFAPQQSLEIQIKNKLSHVDVFLEHELSRYDLYNEVLDLLIEKSSDKKAYSIWKMLDRKYIDFHQNIDLNLLISERGSWEEYYALPNAQNRLNTVEFKQLIEFLKTRSKIKRAQIQILLDNKANVLKMLGPNKIGILFGELAELVLENISYKNGSKTPYIWYGYKVPEKSKQTSEVEAEFFAEFEKTTARAYLLLQHFSALLSLHQGDQSPNKFILELLEVTEETKTGVGIRLGQEAIREDLHEDNLDLSYVELSIVLDRLFPRDIFLEKSPAPTNLH